jgi:hypothetical protein
MVTTEELYDAMRELMRQQLELQLKVAVLQKTLELQNVIAPHLIDAQVTELKERDEYRHAMSVIESLWRSGDEPVQ